MTERAPIARGLPLGFLPPSGPQDATVAMSENELERGIRRILKDLEKQHRKVLAYHPWSSSGHAGSGCNFSHCAYEIRTALGSPLRVMTVGSPRKCAASTRCPSWSRRSFVPMCMTSMPAVYCLCMRYIMYMAYTDDQPGLFAYAPEPATRKRCSKCSELRPVTEFSKRRSRSGLRSECKQCVQLRYNEYRDRRGPDHRRAQSMWQLYRLSWGDYQELLAAQDGRCAICRDPFSDNPRLVHVDHRHGCEHEGKGKESCRDCVRGILCARCNVFVGWVETGSFRLGSILRYIGTDGVVVWAELMQGIGGELLLGGEEVAWVKKVR